MAIPVRDSGSFREKHRNRNGTVIGSSQPESGKKQIVWLYALLKSRREVKAGSLFPGPTLLNNEVED